MACDCPRCQALAKVADTRLLRWRRDPLAPLALETWLTRQPDDWPWWVLGAVIGAIGLLLLPSPVVAAALLLLGGAIAALPWFRHHLAGCTRVSAD